MEKFKFKRFMIHHNGKDYHVIIPQNICHLWCVDWNDDWFGGCFLSGSAESLRNLIAGYGALAFNPYLIVYLPIKNNDIPECLNRYDNGCYDLVFCTNRAQLNLCDWKKIRKKLLIEKWTTYKFNFDIDRMKSYFKKNIDDLKKINHNKLLTKAGANIVLYAETAFFSFPQCYYQMNAVDMHEVFFKDFENEDMSYCYRPESDRWICYDHAYFVYHGVNRKHFTNERPSVCFQLELYDLDIINKYRKKKEVLVKRQSSKSTASKIWEKYISYPVVEIKLAAGNKKDQRVEVNVKGG